MLSGVIFRFIGKNVRLNKLKKDICAEYLNLIVEEQILIKYITMLYLTRILTNLHLLS